MIKDDLASGSLFHELEPDNRINSCWPVARSPGLDNPHVRHKLDVSSRNVPAVKRKRASCVPADLSGFIWQVHRLQGPTELYHASKKFGIGKRFVDALRARRENRFLVNRIRRVRYAI